MVDVGTGVVKSFKDSKDIIGNFAGTTDKAMATVE